MFHQPTRSSVSAGRRKHYHLRAPVPMLCAYPRDSLRLWAGGPHRKSEIPIPSDFGLWNCRLRRRRRSRLARPGPFMFRLFLQPDRLHPVRVLAVLRAHLVARPEHPAFPLPRPNRSIANAISPKSLKNRPKPPLSRPGNCQTLLRECEFHPRESQFHARNRNSRPRNANLWPGNPNSLPGNANSSLGNAISSPSNPITPARNPIASRRTTPASPSAATACERERRCSVARRRGRHELARDAIGASTEPAGLVACGCLIGLGDGKCIVIGY